MKIGARRILFFVAGAPLLGIFLQAAVGLKPVGTSLSPYAAWINEHTLSDRHVTDAVAAVNFDFRAFDTVGEEFILFASVLGAVVLLREQEQKRKSKIRDMRESRIVPEASDAVRLWCVAMMGFTVLFGIYIVTHGQLSPGGGFQGGVILATAPLLVFLSKGFDEFGQIVSHPQVELAEALGASGFVLIGLGALVMGQNYLANILGYGTVGSVSSGGTIPLISLATGLEVTGGFLLLMTAFLQFMFAHRGGRGAK